MKIKAEIMDQAAIERSLRRIAHEIDEQEREARGYLVLGIPRRGISLANRIGETLQKITDKPVSTGHLDISFYRDDRTGEEGLPEVSMTTIPEAGTENQLVIIVDDVIFTGRTARAAMEAVINEGRPAAIRLATLIDRGHREMPIRPDFVGKNVPTSRTEEVQVQVPEYDDAFRVVLVEKEDDHDKK